jgi:hypothetical protein
MRELLVGQVPATPIQIMISVSEPSEAIDRALAIEHLGGGKA